MNKNTLPLTVLALFIVFSFGVASNASAATYYVSSTGSGTTCSVGAPCKPGSVWTLAVPGSIIEFAAGTYQGMDETIRPPSTKFGTQANPITVRCATDGACLIDGQSARTPIGLFNGNDWFIIEGFNVCCSSTSYAPESVVVKLGTGADNNIVRRVVAWDAGDLGDPIFGINDNTGNLLEDIAGFGRGRKIVEWYRSYGPFTIRRAWAMWNSYSAIGPRDTFSIAYSSYNATYENIIGTWDGAATNQPYGVFGSDGTTTSDKCLRDKLLGSIAYVRAVDTIPSHINGVLWQSADCNFFENIVAYVEPGSHTDVRTSYLHDPGLIWHNNTARNLTQIGGAAPWMATSWTYSNNVDVNTVSEAPNIWNGAGTNGARVCKRYQNGVLTNTPLWPWPMDSRIRAALTAAGRNPDSVFGGAGNSVTQQMEKIFGPIPAECRGSGSVTPTPTPPPSTCPNLLNSTLAVPTNFGASFNWFTNAKELLMDVVCSGSTATANIGNGSNTQYIYKTGYVWKNNQWTLFNYSGSNMDSGGNWYIGSANHSLGTLDLTQKQSVLSYICDWNGTSWKCGCHDNTCSTGFWNLQQFKQ